MKVNKSPPRKSFNMSLHDRYQGRKKAFAEAKKLRDKGACVYLQRTGNIGSKLPYSLWKKTHKSIF